MKRWCKAKQISLALHQKGCDQAPYKIPVALECLLLSLKQFEAQDFGDTTFTQPCETAVWRVKWGTAVIINRAQFEVCWF